MERVDICAVILLFVVLVLLSIFSTITAYIAGKSEGFSQGVKYYKDGERAIRSGRVKQVRIID